MALRSTPLGGVHKRRTLVRNRAHIWTKEELDHFTELSKRPRFEPAAAVGVGLRRCKPPRPSSFARGLSELAAAIGTDAQSDKVLPPQAAASTSSLTDAGEDGSGAEARSAPQTPQTPLRRSPPRAAMPARSVGGLEAGLEAGLINLSL